MNITVSRGSILQRIGLVSKRINTSRRRLNKVSSCAFSFTVQDLHLPHSMSTEAPHDQPPGLIICEHCDSLYEIAPLRAGESAYCLRCRALLGRGQRMSLEQWLALTVAAAVLFVLANIFPVISISMKGLSNEVTLWQSVEALAQGRITLIALVAGLSIIFAPLLQIVLLLWVLLHAQRGVIAPGFKACMRALEHLRPWSMLEVCMLGILVAIIKLSGMLDVHPGVGLWAMAMLMVLILLIANRNIRRLWDVLQVKPS